MNIRFYKIFLLLFLLVVAFESSLEAQTRFIETVWFQTNRDIYLSGEQVFFKVNLLESDTYYSSNFSSNIRIELLHEEGRKISQKNIVLINSKTEGKLDLPPDLVTGQYYIRVYSNWMRNYPENYMTTYPIKVIRKQDLYADTVFCQPDGLKIRITTRENIDKTAKYNCSIFTSDKNNNAIPVNGYLLNQNNDTILYYNTDLTGWCNSECVPFNKNEIQAFSEGYSQEQTDISFETINSNVQKNGLRFEIKESFGYLNVTLINTDPSDTYKLIVHRMYSWSWFDTLQTENEKTIFHIPLEDIPSGISQITLLNRENEILYKQLWSDYKPDHSLIDLELVIKELTLDNSYSFEYLVPGYFKNKYMENMNLLINLYLKTSRIYNFLPGLPGWIANSEIPARENAFAGWLNASSYPDEIVSSFFDSNPDIPSVKVLDSYNKDREFYLPELGAGVLEGRIINTINGKGEKDVEIALTLLKNDGFYSDVTDSLGRFAFSFHNVYGNQPFILNTIEKFGPDWKIELVPAFHPISDFMSQSKISLTVEEVEFLKSQSLNLELKRIYGLGENGAIIDSVPQVERQTNIFGIPDIIVNPADFVELPTITDLLFEAVPALTVKNIDGTYKLQVNGPNIYPDSYPTLVLFDGLPVFEFEKLLNLHPSLISSIEIVTDFYVHGKSIYEGVVLFKSRNHDLGGLTLPSSSILSTIILPVKSPGFGKNFEEVTIIDSTPSINETLKWTGLDNYLYGKIGFKTNDNPGQYCLSIYGFDRNGNWYNGQKVFNCKNEY